MRAFLRVQIVRKVRWDGGEVEGLPGPLPRHSQGVCQLVRTFQVLSRAQGAGRAQRRGEGEGAQTLFQCILCGCTGAVKMGKLCGKMR